MERVDDDVGEGTGDDHWGLKTEETQQAWPWTDDDREPSLNGEGCSTKRPTSSSDGESVWGSQGQPIGHRSIDEEKKRQALVACADFHAALVGCLKQGFFVDCSEPKKIFWDCYAEHRGIRGNKIAAWLAPPSFSSKNIP